MRTLQHLSTLVCMLAAFGAVPAYFVVALFAHASR